MSKTYFGICRSIGTNTITGIVANGKQPNNRYATAEEQQAILSLVANSATLSLRDALRDGTYPNAIVVWDKRKDAREAIAELTGSPFFTFSVGEFGEKVRSVKPVIGWRILCGGDPSVFNSVYYGASVKVDHADQFQGDTDANLLFATRSDGRKALHGIKDKDYSLVPVYADA